MKRDTTPFELASKLAPLFDGTVERIEIADVMAQSFDGPMEHWVARAFVRPNHRASVEREIVGAPGPNRSAACENLFNAAPRMAKILNMSPL